jgi:hypothetical protein
MQAIKKSAISIRKAIFQPERDRFGAGPPVPVVPVAYQGWSPVEPAEGS